MSLQELRQLEEQFGAEIAKISGEQELLRLKAALLGKNGSLSRIMHGLGALPPDERPFAGAEANQAKGRIEKACQEALARIQKQKRGRELERQAVDGTLPGRAVPIGAKHPITQVLEEVTDLFLRIGFAVHEGPEVETDFNNFEALNIPPDHPAREMQDTFYIDREAGLLLRTHTSPVQIRVMQHQKPPIRMIAPGPVYRRDSDVSHTPMFHQIEGLVVDRQVRFSDLKGTLDYFLKGFFGGEIPVRFRPSYFPFTEPSAEVDIECYLCNGGKKATQSPCRLCKGTGWLEVMGCGMVHPNVFKKVKYEEVSGFAFGAGIERLAMLKFGIPDIRLFFENDLRFLEQFR